jgi:hypothetical protein
MYVSLYIYIYCICIYINIYIYKYWKMENIPAPRGNEDITVLIEF